MLTVMKVYVIVQVAFDVGAAKGSRPDYSPKAVPAQPITSSGIGLSHLAWNKCNAPLGVLDLRQLSVRRVDTHQLWPI
jgi:hypothetical protein